jgi:hypothetical protein
MKNNLLKIFLSYFYHQTIKMYALYLPLIIIFLFFIIKPPFTFKGLLGYLLLFSKEDFQFNSIIFFFFPYFLSVFTYLIFLKPINIKIINDSQAEKELKKKHINDKNEFQSYINQLKNVNDSIKKQLLTQEQFKKMFDSMDFKYSKLNKSIDEIKINLVLSEEKVTKNSQKEKGNVKKDKSKVFHKKTEGTKS